jgi:hypothetical protein
MIKIGGFFLSNHDPTLPRATHAFTLDTSGRSTNRYASNLPPVPKVFFFTPASAHLTVLTSINVPLTRKREKKKLLSAVGSSFNVYPPPLSFCFCLWEGGGNSDNETGIKMFGSTCCVSLSSHKCLASFSSET